MDSTLDKTSTSFHMMKINISGKLFLTTKETLSKHQGTLLSELDNLDSSYNHEKGEYHFDRSKILFDFILDYYRTGNLHIPKDMCISRVRSELEFWDLPQDCIAECCQEHIEEKERKQEKLKELEKVFTPLSPVTGVNAQDMTCISKVHIFLENPESSVYALIWSIFYTACIVLSMTLMILDSMQSCRQPYTDELKSLLGISDVHMEERKSAIGKSAFSSSKIATDYLNTFILIPLYLVDCLLNFFFTLELAIRLIVSPSKKAHCMNFINICDWIANTSFWSLVLTVWLFPFIFVEPELGHVFFWVFCLRNLRVFRLFRMSRFSMGLRVLMLSMRDSLYELGLLIMIIVIAMLIFGSAVFYAEFETANSQFENIPLGLWWSLITMTSVGYGDFAPVGLPGYIVGGICAVAGLIITSLTIPIVSNNFNMYYDYVKQHKRKNKRNKCPVV